MMTMGGGQMMAMPAEWSPGYGLVIFAMWAVMMMLPSPAPVTLLIDSVARKRAAVETAQFLSFQRRWFHPKSSRLDARSQPSSASPKQQRAQ
jgi:predicted metal-binding membrane protein